LEEAFQGYCYGLEKLKAYQYGMAQMTRFLVASVMCPSNLAKPISKNV
jgi:hypothetical protein